MASTTTSKTKKGPGKPAGSPDDLIKGRKGKTAELSEEELKNVSGGIGGDVTAAGHEKWIE
jgi:bacteriocin-like protein